VKSLHEISYDSLNGGSALASHRAIQQKKLGSISVRRAGFETVIPFSVVRSGTIPRPRNHCDRQILTSKSET